MHWVDGLGLLGSGTYPPLSCTVQDSEVRRSFQRSLEKQGLKFKVGTKVCARQRAQWAVGWGRALGVQALALSSATGVQP